MSADSNLYNYRKIILSLTKVITCTDPAVMTVTKNLMSLLLRKLNEMNYFAGVNADKVSHEFNEICSSQHIQEQMKIYSRSRECLDHFWNSIMERNNYIRYVFPVMQMVLIKSKGNGNVEQGFSVTSERFETNTREGSVMAGMCKYDANSFNTWWPGFNTFSL